MIPAGVRRDAAEILKRHFINFSQSIDFEEKVVKLEQIHSDFIARNCLKHLKT